MVADTGITKVSIHQGDIQIGSGTKYKKRRIRSLYWTDNLN